MDALTLATEALAIASPYLQKIGEGTSRKIGEDIWNLIKKPFTKKGKELSQDNIDEVKPQLVNILEEDKDLYRELENLVVQYKNQQTQVVQNISNAGGIQKQVNVGSNIGDINL